ncbi:MAG TPA: hypothetical protein VIM21_07360 [Gemmatimonadaceae bacterium]
MLRARFSFLAASLFALALAACSENPNELKSFVGHRTSLIQPPTTLDQGIVDILGLFPKGLETAATTRWGNVKQKYAAGLTDPAQMTVAKQMLFELSDWVNQKTPNMDNPTTGETKTAAAARAVLYMALYVYGGPTTTPPPASVTADNAVGVVTPTAPATIVTPTKHAGVQLDAGSVAENTIIVVTQTATSYPDDCTGPLQTKFCQYPQFYTFEMFPHKTLLKPATFNVCHVNVPGERSLLPGANHNHFRLAHPLPANPADRTPGSTISEGDGESIEMLQLVPQSFSTCENSAYLGEPVVTVGALGILSHLAKGLQHLLSPKMAYAIDLGLGGLSKSMSPFNDVDPEGRPDRVVQSVSVASTSLRPGNHASVSFSIGNIGRAIARPVQATIRLTQPAVEGEGGVDVELASLTIPSIAPGKVFSMNDFDVIVPATIPDGSYSLGLVVGDEEVFPDVSLDNNAAGIPVSVTTVRDQMIRITAQIDGRSQLILRGNTAQWHHFDYTAPGLWFANAPTTVNGYDWYPSWPNGTGSGSTSSVLESVSPALPASPIPVALALIEGRGSVTVVQQPTADNSYTTVIDFNDNEFGGAVFYTVEVWFASVASP